MVAKNILVCRMAMIIFLMMNRPDLVKFIQSTYPLPLESATVIAGHFRERSFHAGELLLKQGKQCNEYLVLREGHVRAFTFDLDGNDVTTNFYSAPAIVCELSSFFKKLPSGENLQALTDGAAYCLTFEELQDVFHSMPAFREFGRTILVNEYAALKQRMLAGLHKTADERYAILMQSNPQIFQHAPLKHIASFLGVTDSSLSRIRREAAKRKPDDK